MDSSRKIEFSLETAAGTAQLLRFLTLPHEYGYTFASSKDERLIPLVNARLAQMAKESGKTVSTGFLAKNTDSYLLPQIESLAASADALIIPNLGEFIAWSEDGDTPEDHRFLSELNFAREGITAIGKPIVFWASEKMIHLLTQQAQDLFSQRRMSTVYFEQQVPQVADWTRLPDLEQEEEEVDVEGLLLRQASLRAQLDVAQRIGLPPTRIAAEMAVPLAIVNSTLGEHEAAIHLLDEYWHDLKNPDAVTVLQCLLVELLAGRSGAKDHYWDMLYLANREPGELRNKLLEITKIANNLGDPYLYTQALDWIGRTFKETGHLEEAELVYSVYLENILALKEANPDAELIQSRLGRANVNLGDIHQAHGQFELALESYEKGLSIAEVLAVHNPQAEPLHRNLAIAYYRIGEINQSQGRLDKAMEAIQKSLQILQRLAEKNSSSETLQRDILACYGRIGDIYQSQNSLKTAKIHFHNSLKISEKLLQANPNSFQIHWDHFLSLSRIARLEFRKKDLPSSLASLEAALQEAQFLADHRGTTDDLYWLQNTKDRIAALQANTRPPGW